MITLGLLPHVLAFTLTTTRPRVHHFSDAGVKSGSDWSSTRPVWGRGYEDLKGCALSLECDHLQTGDTAAVQVTWRHVLASMT